MSEVDRIRAYYEQRQSDVIERLYSLFNQASLFENQGRQQRVLALLERSGLTHLKDKRILDVGCGTGGELRNFIQYGARPENLYGIDLLEGRIDEARALNPRINYVYGNAERLPYPDGFFDLVMQSTMFTSIIDKAMKMAVALQMMRVLKPHGIILWYDYFVSNPANRNARGIRLREIHSLFPGCRVTMFRMTLAPPIARVVAPVSWLACHLLEKLPFLCTHYLGLIRISDEQKSRDYGY